MLLSNQLPFSQGKNFYAGGETVSESKSNYTISQFIITDY